MGMGSVVIQEWPIVLLPLINCNKDGSPKEKRVKPLLLGLSTLIDDTMKTSACCSDSFFKLQGESAEDG